MPWSVERPPAAMANLPWPVREKAVAIANALLKHGRGEGQAIRLVIRAAWRWARRRGLTP